MMSTTRSAVLDSIVGTPDQQGWRGALAVASVAIGGLLSVIAWIADVREGVVLVPLSLGLIAAACIAPFPAADYLLALLVGATLPLLPPTGLPNVPLGMAVIGVAIIRIAPSSWSRIPRATVLVLGVLWTLMAMGLVASDWPQPALWLRPTVIVAVAAVATILGALVATDPGRARRWMLGFGALAALVAITALIFYTLQFAFSLFDLVQVLASLQAYVRGEQAGEFFASINNWVIWSPAGGVVRAVSVFVPAPHAVGGYMGLILPFFAVAFLSRSLTASIPVPMGRAIATLLVVGFAALVLTLSRASWLAAAAAGLVTLVSVLVAARTRGVVRRFAAMALGALAVLAVCGATVLVSGQRAEGVTERVTNVEEDDSTTGRVESDRRAIEEIARRPLSGYGLGGWAGPTAPEPGASYIHNVYLEYAGALGLPGLAWALMIPGVLIASGVAQLRRHGDAKFVGLGFLAVGTFALVHFMFDDSFLVPQYAWLLMITLGAAAVFLARPAAAASLTTR